MPTHDPLGPLLHLPDRERDTEDDLRERNGRLTIVVGFTASGDWDDVCEDVREAVETAMNGLGIPCHEVEDVKIEED